MIRPPRKARSGRNNVTPEDAGLASSAAAGRSTMRETRVGSGINSLIIEPASARFAFEMTWADMKALAARLAFDCGCC